MARLLLLLFVLLLLLSAAAVNPCCFCCSSLLMLLTSLLNLPANANDAGADYTADISLTAAFLANTIYTDSYLPFLFLLLLIV